MPSHQERRHARYKPCERGTAPHDWVVMDIIRRDSFNKKKHLAIDLCTFCGKQRPHTQEPVS